MSNSLEPSAIDTRAYPFMLGDISVAVADMDRSNEQQDSEDSEDTQELTSYLNFLQINDSESLSQDSYGLDEVKTTPLFTWPVKSLTSFQQYSILGHELTSPQRPARDPQEQPVFLNTDAPWSAFLCGSQGSGKSHTLSCMLESCLLNDDRIGRTQTPLTGIVFAYDAQSAAVACEAAFLSTKVKVNVLVSPSNYHDMKTVYGALPGMESSNVQVFPLLLKDHHINTQRMLKMMAFGDGSTSVPLYMEVLIDVIKKMKLTASDGSFKYNVFRAKLKEEKLDRGQSGPLNLRLQLLESFLESGELAKKLGKPATAGSPDVFKPEAGTLTIVDLTDPCIDAAGACSLFDICLSLFMENTTIPKIVALDEAHKFMKESEASNNLTESLLQIIREQRHKGVRVVVATQEPTISPKLLDLCSFTMVHRFTSPQWLSTLQKHLAGASSILDETNNATTEDGSGNDSGRNVRQLFGEIVNLNVGESLLFSPSAMLDIKDGSAMKLGMGYVKFKTRPRMTADGGKSVMATLYAPSSRGSDRACSDTSSDIDV